MLICLPNLQTLAIGLALVPRIWAWDRDALSASRNQASALGSATVPGRYIVEFEGGSALGQRDVRRRADSVIGDLESQGYDVNIKEDYSSISSRFQGVSIQISNDQEGTLDDLKDISGVADAWPVELITLGVDFDTSDPSPKWNPHIATRVDELHQRGIKGKGQRVCIVDSGVDSSHPALSGRIAGGKNMLDDTTNLEDCNGHGTFVSSVVVGSNNDFSGVAPEAEVYMYKIFGCDSSTSNDIVLKGILAADADDCDIVSLSLGGDNGYSDSFLSRVASRVAKDRLVIIAAGNSGEMGIFYASSPASGRGVVSVASVNSRQVLGWPATILSTGGDSFNLSYVTPDGQKLNESISVPLSLDSGDSCNPEEYGSESEAIAVRRGVCFPMKQYNTLSSTGFGYYLIFDSYNQGVFYMSDIINTNPSVHLFAVTQAAVGDWVKEQVSAGHILTLEVEADAETAASESDFPAGGQISSFTSWGPTFENDFSPKIAAPGGAVYGAFPDNTFAIASGTSFSTPYIAGVAALFFAHVKKDAGEFSRRISSTAALLPSYSQSEESLVSEIAPLAQQGAGLVDAVKVMDYTIVLVSESHISLNDTDNRIDTHVIQLKNTGSSLVTFKVSHVAASSVQARDEYLYPYEHFPPLLDAAGSIEAPESIAVPAGATKELQVTINSPENLEPNSGVVWSGKIVLEGSNGEFVAVPYMGVEASTYNWTPLEGSPLAFRYDSESGYLYPVDWEGKAYKPAELDSPEIYFALRYGTYEFSIDLVGADWTKEDFEYPLSAESGANKWFGSVRTQPDVFGSYTNFPSQYPVRFSNVGFNKFQCFSNGTDIPSGRYRILSRALRMFGNPTNPSDWQLFLSDPFSVQYGDDPITSSSSATVTSSSDSSTQTVASASTTTDTPETTDAPATTTENALETPTSVPGVTKTLRAASDPTGITNAFADISLRRQGISSSDIYDPSEWMELHVQMKIPTRLMAGSVASFALPSEIVDVAENDYVQASSGLVGSASFDQATGLYSITFNDWVEWHSDITGDFYLYCKFAKEFQTGLEAGTYFVEIATPGKTFFPPVYYRAVDRTKVYERKSVDAIGDQQVFYFYIEVPGQIGPWKSVTFVGSHASGDDGFLCTETTVEIGTSFDLGNQIIESQNVTAESVKRCQVKNFKAVYSSEIAEDEVLAFNIANILGEWSAWTISLSYSLAIELTNGSTIGYDLRTLSYDRFARESPDNWITGVVDRTGPIGGGTATQSVSPSSTPLPSSLSSSMEDTTAVTPIASISTTLVSISTAFTLVQNSTGITSQVSATSTESSTDLSATPTNPTATDISSHMASSVTSAVTDSHFPTLSSQTIPASTSSAPELSGSTVPTSVLIPGHSSYSESTNSAHSVSKSTSGGPIPSFTESISTGADTTSEVLSKTSAISSITTKDISDSVVTQSVTIITSICSEPGWTEPATVTLTIPCASSGQTEVTTVTSVCTRCAEHPVTVTYTQPVQTVIPSNSISTPSYITISSITVVSSNIATHDNANSYSIATSSKTATSSSIVISSGGFSVESIRSTVSEVQNQGSFVTIPTVDNHWTPASTTSRQYADSALTSYTLSLPTTSADGLSASEAQSATRDNNEGSIPTSETVETLSPSATQVASLGTELAFKRIRYLSVAAVAALIFTL